MTHGWRIAHDCLAAIAYGALLPEWEFATVMGHTRREARDALADWTAPPTGKTQAVAQSAMVNVLGYPHGAGEQMVDVTGWTMREIQQAWQDCFAGGDGSN